MFNLFKKDPVKDAFDLVWRGIDVNDDPSWQDPVLDSAAKRILLLDLPTEEMQFQVLDMVQTKLFELANQKSEIDKRNHKAIETAQGLVEKWKDRQALKYIK